MRICSLLPILCAALVALTARSSAAAVADFHIAAETTRINAALYKDLGLSFYLLFSTEYTEDPERANRLIELATPPATYSHWCYMIMVDSSGFPSTTIIGLNLPLHIDDNANGIPDFYEKSQPIRTATTGRYPDLFGAGAGTIQFSWRRDAGLLRGSCIITLQDPVLGTMGPFNGSFEIVEFEGSFAYEHQPGSITATVLASNPLDPAESLQGPLTLRRDPDNRFNHLLAQSNVWESATLTLPFNPYSLVRSVHNTNVYQATATHPYIPGQRYRITLTDPNDSDQDGIPDLSDDPTDLPAPNAPSLAVEHTPTEFVLSIRGDNGRLHHLMQATRPDALLWETTSTWLFSGDLCVLHLPHPTNTSLFWRVRAE